MNKINSQQFYAYSTPVQFSSMCNNAEYFTQRNQPQTNTSDFITPEISSSARAYGLSVINRNKRLPQMSLQDLIKWFEAQGKVEGKDFEILSHYTFGNTVVSLKNKEGKECLCVHYDGGNRKTWDGYETSEYKNGQLDKVISRNSKGEILYITQFYQPNDVKHLDPYLSYSTTPTEYAKHLKEKGINHSINYEKESEDNRSVYIDIFDANNKLKDTVCFHYAKNKSGEPSKLILKRNYNEQGEEVRRMSYEPNSTGITTYIKPMGKMLNNNNTEESFEEFASRMNSTFPDRTTTVEQKVQAIKAKRQIMAHPECPSEIKPLLQNEINAIQSEIDNFYN